MNKSIYRDKKNPRANDVGWGPHLPAARAAARGKSWLQGRAEKKIVQEVEEAKLAARHVSTHDLTRDQKKNLSFQIIIVLTW